MSKNIKYHLHAIGFVERKNNSTAALLLPRYKRGLENICYFSHLHLFWVGDRATVEIDGCDAFNGTPVIGLLPYQPGKHRVRECRLPPWLSHWPQWFRETDKGESAISIRPADVRQLDVLLSDPVHGSGESVSIKKKHHSGKSDSINLYGARQNNLKDIDVSFPMGKLTVVTGVSGSGKSSLAFDTLYAEGQRRYMQSLSTGGRSAAANLEKPDFDNVENLQPAVAIEQKNLTMNPRSTVGTVSDVYSYLRLLFARLGTRHCPRCGLEVSPQSAESLSRRILKLPEGTELVLFSGKPEEKSGSGYSVSARDKASVLNGLVSRCYAEGNGFLTLEINDGQSLCITERPVCTGCGEVFFRMSPSLFSYNSPEGMCETCNGLGHRMDVDPEKIIPRPGLSILDGASPWYGDLRGHRKKPNANWFRNEILALAEAMNVDLELPWQNLPEDFRQKALFGSGEEEFTYRYKSGKTGREGTITRPVGGAVPHLQRLFSNSKAGNSQEVYKQFLNSRSCSDCKGERLRRAGRLVMLGGRRYPEVASLSVEKAFRWMEELPKYLSADSRELVAGLLEELTARLQAMNRIGLGYLTLDRTVTSLSGGEAQRIKLAGQLGCGLSGLLYVLDEPSIGLHARDHHRMIDTMKQLRDAGNTLVVVEHDEQTIRSADHIIDIGEGAGHYGGRLVAEGSPEEILNNPDSITGRFLKGNHTVELPAAGPSSGFLELKGATLHNLQQVNVRFPLGRVSCVAGVSGSGKSSLVRGTLLPALLQKLNKMEADSGPYQFLSGLEDLDKVISVDQSSIGRTPRSIPATYIGVFDEIRKLFSGTELAKKKKMKAANFSFNDKKSRCPACEGGGRIRVEMSFMPDSWIRCRDCEGRRYKREVLDVTYRDRSIADVLEMEVAEAIPFFEGEDKVLHFLEVMGDVGLDYLKLGQSSATLSGGEAQRIKLARELVKQETGKTLYMLDEPTTGLHFSDVSRLLQVLHKLAARGNTVIIIEHNLTVIRTSHWVVDLGPDGGDRGGQVLGQGSPEEISRIEHSFTGAELRQAQTSGS